MIKKYASNVCFCIINELEVAHCSLRYSRYMIPLHLFCRIQIITINTNRANTQYELIRWRFTPANGMSRASVFDDATDDAPDLDKRARPTLVAFWLKRMQEGSERSGGRGPRARLAGPYKRLKEVSCSRSPPPPSPLLFLSLSRWKKYVGYVKWTEDMHCVQCSHVNRR